MRAIEFKLKIQNKIKILTRHYFYLASIFDINLN